MCSVIFQNDNENIPYSNIEIKIFTSTPKSVNFLSSALFVFLMNWL